MTETNWPDPNRPGVPLFPEKTLRHVLKKKDTGEIIIRNWKSDGQHWDMIGHSAQWCSETYFYEGPCLTPTQIAEMLAGKYSVEVIQTALRVWDALDECDRTDADDMILLEQHGLMTRGVVEDANDFEDLELGETVWHFNAAGDALVSAIRNIGSAP